MKRFLGTALHLVSFAVSATMLWLYFVSPSVLSPVESITAPQVASAVTFPVSSSLPNPNDILRLVNEARKNEGLDPLIGDAILLQIAENRAEDMAAQSYYSHTSPNGETYFDAIKTAGEAPTFACENLGLEFSRDATTYVQSWLNSQSHRTCLFDSRAVRAGYAVRVLNATPTETQFVVVAIHASR